jgi:molybdopterin-guanine dinucleotide biosynthesis protein A
MTEETVLGVVLAGGLARRMGADKANIRIGGRTMLARALARLAPQCDGLILSANGDAARFEAFGFPVVTDPIEGFAGPLAGLLAALEWAAVHRPDVGWVASLPVDCPFAPRDLVARLRAAAMAERAALAIAESGGRQHPIVGLWRPALRDDLRRALAEGERKVDRFAGRFGPAVVAWPIAPLDPFFNVNAPADVAQAERLAALDGE